MSPPKSTDLPPFCVPEPGMALNVVPPFPFEGMTARVFPLRASLDALQQFCDSYMNIVPPELGRFRAMSPYVQLMILDYGKMAVKVRNVGWMAQREVLFSFPVEWYRVVDGKWLFHDWATISPFIYVDDDMSMSTGRLVYGWPKTIARLTPTQSEWLSNPLASLVQASVSTMVFPELYKGSKLRWEEFLTVERQGPVASMGIPPDARNPLMPWTVASNVAESLAGFSRDAFGLLRGLGLWPMHDGTSADNYLEMAGRLSVMGFPPRPKLLTNTINLKQFRRSERPEDFCYQALTNGPMQLISLNRAGLLGEERMLLGDATGGYRITLHEWPSLPIVETLGLEVARRWRGDACDMVELHPVVPHWYDANMVYQEGRNIASRIRDGQWHDDQGLAYPFPPRSEFEKESDQRYVTTLGASQAAVAGPFRFSNTTIRVLPLLAEKSRLRKFLEDYVNVALRGSNDRFSLWAAQDSPAGLGYVYLTATSFGDVTSPANNIGDWANFEFAYLVPVRHERRREDGSWELCGVGLLPALTFVDSVTAAAAGSEVLGIPTLLATFDEPPSVWMESDGPSTDAVQALLQVAAEVEPAVGEGQRTEIRQIVDISEGTLPSDLEGLVWRNTADRWALMLRQELERKKRTKLDHREALKRARALALELLGNRKPFSLYTLKQVRDVVDPTKACYQSLVRIERTLDDVLDLREIEQPIVMRLHDYPTFPMKELLGIVGKQLDDPGAGIVYAVLPIRPFWMRVTMSESLGQMLLWRTTKGPWKPPEPGDPQWDSYLCPEADIQVGSGVSSMQDYGDPRRMAKTGLDWLAFGHRRPGERHLEPAEAREALETIDPQMVIETILSREWGNWSGHSRWRDGRRAIEAMLRKCLAGLPADQVDTAVTEFFTMAVQTMNKLPGQPPLPETLPFQMVAALGEFQRLRSRVDSLWIDITGQLTNRERTLARQERDLAHLIDMAREFRSALSDVADKRIIGEWSTGDRRADYSPSDDEARLRELLANALDPAREPIELFRQSCREAVDLARRRCSLQREALINMLSKGFQKPDFVIRRDSAGPDRERLFPRAEAWDDNWYVGPPIEESRDRPDGKPRAGTAGTARTASKRRKRRPE